eukprot:CAMPEP_0174834826 /NCGR_PEP_ID=MMETSP1114-20130205/5068_1 /TAXON_ID=312471 /ORGANISM="Neobodo designis, Strain CCAP 1951/1" /LENGTH=407 /DNA_ID=CAMNT_0016068755 /DNA_START=35 /DNA_END=1258 /DNA_ORIENTATION=+
MSGPIAGGTPSYTAAVEAVVPTAKAARAAIWRHTYEVFRTGQYRPEDGGGTPDGVLPASIVPESLAISLFRPGTHFGAPPQPPKTAPIRVLVQDIDCLVAAERLASAGMPPLVMDAGSRRHFGGGYQNGSRAQEEELCRRTSLALQCDCSQGWQTTHLYPLPPAAAIHVPRVQVIRHGADRQYRLMSKPFECGVGIVAAYNKPKLDATGRAIVGQAAKDTREMLRSFFGAAATNGYKSVVCIAVGCGAFCNPAGHVAQLFAEVLKLPEVRGSCIEEAVFAVLDDHNAFHRFNPDGNFLAFARTLAREASATVRSRDGTDVTQQVLNGGSGDGAPVTSAGSATLVSPPQPHAAHAGADMQHAEADTTEAKRKKKTRLQSGATKPRKPALVVDDDNAADDVIDVDAESD